MKKAIGFIVIGLLLGTQVPTLMSHNHDEGQGGMQQGGWNYNNPEAKFNTRNNLVNQSTITWLTVDNLQATCEAESRKRGNNGFGYTLQACSFWVKNTCTIITQKQTSLHQLGHETLHCFQGAFH
jgi:hypothetical protein